MTDNRYIVDTPENIEFAYEIAGIGSRLLAAIVDTLLLVLLELALAFVMGVLLQQIGLLNLGDGLESGLLALWGALAFLFLWGYYLAFELLWNGQSPGKRLLGLRVIQAGGRPIGFAASAIRNLMRLVDLLPGLYGIGVLSMFIDPRARRLGDLAAGTLVVREQHALTLESLSAGTSPPFPLHSAPQAPSLPSVALLTPQEHELLQEFLERRTELGSDSRARLGQQLAAALRAKLNLPDGPAEPLLEYIAREYEIYTVWEKRQQEGYPNCK
jgi:uncharacterized RDD family membrane protein YckC